MDDNRRLQLQNFDNNKGKAPFEKEEIILTDTIFYDVSTSVTDSQFFNAKSIDKQYQNKNFPVTSHAYKFTYARITHTMRFTAADALADNNYIQYFDEYSHIVFQKENKVLGGRFSLATFTPYEWIPASSGAATDKTAGIKEKFSSWFKFAVPILVGAGKDFSVNFIAAKGLTTAAYAVGLAPFYANTPTGTFTNANRGFGIKLELRGERWLESQ